MDQDCCLYSDWLGNTLSLHAHPSLCWQAGVRTCFHLVSNLTFTCVCVCVVVTVVVVVVDNPLRVYLAAS